MTTNRTEARAPRRGETWERRGPRGCWHAWHLLRALAGGRWRARSWLGSVCTIEPPRGRRWRRQG